eukprot:646732-Pelagomonas_calceolata.AAC.1
MASLCKPVYLGPSLVGVLFPLLDVGSTLLLSCPCRQVQLRKRSLGGAPSRKFPFFPLSSSYQYKAYEIVQLTIPSLELHCANKQVQAMSGHVDVKK